MKNPIDQPPEVPPKVCSLTIEYDGSQFHSKLDGEIPIIPLLGVMFLQAISLAARQMAANEQQAAIARAMDAAKGGTLFMPDGTPYKS